MSNETLAHEFVHLTDTKLGATSLWREPKGLSPGLRVRALGSSSGCIGSFQVCPQMRYFPKSQTICKIDKELIYSALHSFNKTLLSNYYELHTCR